MIRSVKYFTFCETMRKEEQNSKKEKTVKQEMKKKLTMGEKADRIIHRKM